MNYTFLIFQNFAITDCRLFKAYQLNTPFSDETVYTLNDGTKVQITSLEHILHLLSSRKSNDSALGEIIKIDNPDESERVVRNLKLLIENGKIELPGAIKDILNYDPNKEIFLNSFDPRSN